MSKKELQKLTECRNSGCRYFARACEIYHGNNCSQLSGNKIPRMRYYAQGRADSIPERPLGSLMKPHFMVQE